MKNKSAYSQVEALERIYRAKSHKNKHLNLHGIGINAIPQEINQLNTITSIDISDNLIEDISALNNFKLLVDLDISNNLINNISVLSHLDKLEYINASNNKISDISPLQYLLNLTKLNLSTNKIEIIKPLKDCNRLIDLDISNNYISDIYNLSELISINRLIANNNNNITNLTAILSIIKNIKIRKKLANTSQKKFYEFSCSSCPTITPPIEITNRGLDSIINYFDELDSQGTSEINEAKLLIVGEGGAGKTTLTRRLVLGLEASMPDEEETTKGISIVSYDFKSDTGKIFKIHIWDFGGQEIYHATHQFFLTKRSLYILVDDTRKDDKSIHDASFNYWLQVVELLSNNSPLLIVQNEKGDRSKEIDLSGMRGRFANIKERYRVNLLSYRGVEDLRKDVKFHVQKLPHIGETLPKQWAIIRHRIEEIANISYHISFQEYLQLCEKNLMPDKDRALKLSEYLHDLGIFLHFQDDIILKNIIILNNNWVTDAVYKVIDNEEIKRKFGRFSVEDLNNIWADDKYSSKSAELLALMMRFELCYMVQERPLTTWLIPQLLPLETPSIDWNISDNLVVIFSYDFMPKGILPRVIVRMHRYISNQKESWRAGVRLTWQRNKGSLNTSEALIIETYGGREVVVRVKGNEAKEFLEIISETFDYIHDSYPGIKVKKYIPCICEMCRTSDHPHLYSYDALIYRKKKLKKKTIECAYSAVDVEVDFLLDGKTIKVPSKNKEELIKMLKNNEIENVLQYLNSIKNDDTIIMLTANYSDIKKKEIIGVIDPQTLSIESNKMNMGLLNYITTNF
jgi:Leucine-rich repeat (LRR) protein